MLRMSETLWGQSSIWADGMPNIRRRSHNSMGSPRGVIG